MKKIITSLAVIVIVTGVAFGVTGAWFTDQEDSDDNMFTAGTLDMKLSNDGSSYSDGVTATWTSPSNWAPGETVDGTLYFTNSGSIDIMQMAINFNTTNTDGDNDGSEMDEQIIVTKWIETHNGTEGEDQVAFVEQHCGTKNDILTLAELNDCNFFGQGTGPITSDNVSDPNGDILMEGGDKKDFELDLEFKFATSSDDSFQGDSCKLDITFDGRQNCPWFPDFCN
jgi:spore coat-associated protein N